MYIAMSDTLSQNNNMQSAGEPTQEELLAGCRKERDEYLNSWKRAKADLINYKKEEDQRFREIASFATLGMVRELLAGMDSFAALEKSLKGESRSDSERDLISGILAIKNQFEEILKRQGVMRIPVQSGLPPDPRLHEAISEVRLEQERAELDGKIIEELVAGYTMGERVIRAAKVSIGKIGNVQ